VKTPHPNVQKARLQRAAIITGGLHIRWCIVQKGVRHSLCGCVCHLLSLGRFAWQPLLSSMSSISLNCTSRAPRICQPARQAACTGERSIPGIRAPVVGAPLLITLPAPIKTSESLVLHLWRANTFRSGLFSHAHSHPVPPVVR
jgi:hypothetical protein